MYQFITGPLLWFSLSIFFVGLFVRLVLYVKGLDWKLDRVTYRVNISYGLKGAVRSIFSWLLPMGTRRWRTSPGMAFLFFVFHFGLLFTPLFLLAHNIILKQRWGIGWMTIPDALADILTVAVVVTGIFLCLRRIALPEVRILTTTYDFLLLAIAMAPFITGFLAMHHASDYSFWLTAHILCGEVMLIAIPITKLSHFILFFLSRAQLGMDFGIKRGGMKGKGLAW